MSTVPQSRVLSFTIIALFGAAADLLTKQWVFAWRGLPGENPPWWIWEGYVGIETAINPGALFGMGAGYGLVFAALSLVAGAAILAWLFVFRAAQSLWLTIALACVFAGIIGNLYDRLDLWVPLGYQGERGVRDWILFRYGQYTWPNFNIADCGLVCGAAMLAWHSFRGPSQEQEAAQES